MAAGERQAENDVMDEEHRKIDQNSATAAQSADDASLGDVNSKSKFECHYCDKSYTTKRSLSRHVNSIDTACARQRFPQDQVSGRPSKPRWACSRCGKDCATNSSVERHITNSCWRTCDECIIDGVSRCDSAIKVGPCRTCEAKERPCTKHTSPILGTQPEPFTGPAAQAEDETHANDETVSLTNQRPAKRKSHTVPELGPAETHKSKRKVLPNHHILDYGLERYVDPLGGQAHVPSQVKKAAVSDWLQEQFTNSAPSAQDQEEKVQDFSPHVAQAGFVQNDHDNQQSQQLFGSVQRFAHALPASPPSFSSRPTNEIPTPCYKHQIPLAQPFRTYQNTGYGLAATPQLLGLRQLPSFGGGLSTQLDRLFLQMQITRQQNQAHEIDMARRFGTRNKTIPSLQADLSSSSKFDERNMSQAQVTLCTSPLQRSTPNGFGQDDAILTLRIHSNTHDKNGQPIFSVLRIHRNEIFGPRLDAYCNLRGQTYGVHWMFVYRYQASIDDRPEQQMQITLTWGMTPADIKDEGFPGVAMRNMDTIYVMQAKLLASSSIEDALNKGDAVQSPGPQVSHSEVDIDNGETLFFQNPDISWQWYLALEQDAAGLRAACGSMKITIVRQQKQIAAQDTDIANQDRSLRELIDLSRQLRHRMQLPDSDPLVQALEQGFKDAGNHFRRQQPAALQPQQLPQQDKEQAVRGSHQTTPLPELAQLPSFGSAFSIPESPHQPSMNTAQMQHCDCIYDTAAKVGADSEGDEVSGL